MSVPQETPTDTPTDTRKYRITFDRIGRDRHAAPAEFDAEGPTHLAQLIDRYVRARLLSRDVEVIVNLESMGGAITVGFSHGGSFTIEILDGE